MTTGKREYVKTLKISFFKSLGGKKIFFRPSNKKGCPYILVKLFSLTSLDRRVKGLSYEKRKLQNLVTMNALTAYNYLLCVSQTRRCRYTNYTVQLLRLRFRFRTVFNNLLAIIDDPIFRVLLVSR